MPRNSHDNSIDKFHKIEEIVKPCLLKPKRQRFIFKKLSIRAISNKRKINKVNKAYKVLGEPYRTIFKNTFLKKSDIYWWMPFYSKTTYYRLRNKTISSFLSVYEEL